MLLFEGKKRTQYLGERYGPRSVNDQKDQKRKRNRDGGNEEVVLLQTGRRGSFGSPVGGMPILYASLKRPKWYRVAGGKGYFLFLGVNSSLFFQVFPRNFFRG